MSTIPIVWRDVLEAEQQSKCYVNKLFCAALSLDSSEFKEYLTDVDCPELFPGFTGELPQSLRGNFDEINEWMLHHNRLGFYAECYVPQCSNFRFNSEDKPVSWSVYLGLSQIIHLYADSIPELLSKMGQEAGKLFEEAWQEELQNKY